MIMNECPHCGANLDPGEKCDCTDRKNMVISFWQNNVQKTENGQLKLDLRGEQIWQQ